MVSALPSRVMNYKVSAASPTDELFTIGQILSEMGAYACTILDREHLAFSRKCATRLKKVVSELTSRGRIQSPDDLYEMPTTDIQPADLSAMTISELYDHYRQWPERHEQRLKEGREHMTYYYEGRIVRELQRRHPATTAEQLKIDYCTATYATELENLSRIFSLPVHAEANTQHPDTAENSPAPADVCTDPANACPTPAEACPIPSENYPTLADAHAPDSADAYTPDELAALITRYASYRDIAGRERLIETVDLALAALTRHPRNNQDIQLLQSEITKLQLRKTIRIPNWVNIRFGE